MASPAEEEEEEEDNPMEGKEAPAAKDDEDGTPVHALPPDEGKQGDPPAATTTATTVAAAAAATHPDADNTALTDPLEEEFVAAGYAAITQPVATSEKSNSRDESMASQETPTLPSPTGTTTAAAAGAATPETPYPSAKKATATVNMVTVVTTPKEGNATTAAPQTAPGVRTIINQAAALAVQGQRPLKRPPPVSAPLTSPPPRDSAFCAAEWDNGWAEQFDHRKRRKVVAALLPPHTIGRVEDPVRLPKTACRCRVSADVAGAAATTKCLTYTCSCHALGLFCSEACSCYHQCRNNRRHAPARHASIFQLVRRGGGSIEAACCPCKGLCSAKNCPCVLRGQHCRHRVNHDKPCKNPWGCEQPWSNFSLEGSEPLLALSYFMADQPVTNPTAPPKHRNPLIEASPLTEVEVAWDEAHVKADAAFADNHPKARSVLEPLMKFAKEAHIEAQTQLKLNRSEKWWWSRSVPVAALPAKASPEEDALVCQETCSSLVVEEETGGKDRLDDIVQATQETMILRYAATFLRDKARQLAQRRLAAAKGRPPT